MRTKTLLLTAALSAAGIATSMAQTTVYSVNAVGYVNKTLVHGFNLISNPLTATDNKIGTLFASLPDDTVVYKFTPGAGFSSTTKDVTFQGAAANATVTPGEGVFVQIPPAAPATVTVTFVGEVPQNVNGQPLTTPLVRGFQIVSSKVPIAGSLSSLGYVADQDDVAYKFDTTTQRYNSSTFDLGSWDNGEPSLAVGEAMFLQKTGSGTWTKSFTVSP